MSGVQTHMLIGAVGGLALERLAPQLVGTALPLPSLPGQAVPVVTTLAIVVGTAILATWPDIDEPGSWIGRRVRLVVTLLCLPLGALLGMSLSRAGFVSLMPLAAAGVGGLTGLLVVGPLLGMALLRLIRHAAGGHRRLTHSLVLGALLAGVAVLLARIGSPFAVVPAALVVGQLLHLAGDVVTPAGVPVLWPFVDRDLRVLPQPLCRFGELLIALAAAIVGLLLLGVVRIG